MASFTCKEALAMVFYDSESEFNEGSDESNDEGESINLYDENSGEMGQTVGDIADSSVSNHDPTNIDWAFYSLDPFESVWLPKYNEKPAILIETTDFEPVDYFYTFFPEKAFKLIVEETNRYAD